MTLGTLGEFFLTGSSDVVNEEILSSGDADLIGQLTEQQIKIQSERINQRIRAGQTVILEASYEAGSKVTSDYMSPDPNTPSGTLHAIAMKLVRGQEMAEHHQPVSEPGASQAHVKFAYSSIASNSKE